MLRKSVVLYLVPDLFGKPGGIARYCQMVCRAVENSNICLNVVALKDSPVAMKPSDNILRYASYYPCNFSYSLFLQKAIRVTLQERPSVIIVGHPNFATLGWALAKLVGARLVTFIYGIDIWQPLTGIRRFGLHQSEMIISISQFTAKKAAHVNGVATDLVRILYNCVDPQFMDSRVSSFSNNKLSMLTVGRISSTEYYKGHNYVIKAMPSLLKQYPTLTYDIVGDGDGRPMLEMLAEEIGVKHAVRFHGAISDTELQQQYRNATLFIMPSRNEGFGFVFAEAMAYGIPAIGGNMDATPEVIVDGVTGILVNPLSVEEIIAAASRLLEDEQLRVCMGKAAQLHVMQCFSFEQFQNSLWKHLAELGCKL